MLDTVHGGGVNKMSEQTIGQKLKELIERSGLSYYKLEQLTGISSTYISDMAKGGVKHPRIDTLKRLASALNVDVIYFIVETPTLEQNKSNEPLKNIRESLSEIEALLKQSNVTHLPLYGSVPAGYPITFQDEVSETVVVPAEVVTGIDQSRLFVLRVHGSSLTEDNIHPGDYLIVLRDAPYEEGKLYVLNIPGDGSTVKHLYRTPDGKARLVPANHEYKEMIYDEVQVVGRVIRAFKVQEL